MSCSSSPATRVTRRTRSSSSTRAGSSTCPTGPASPRGRPPRGNNHESLERRAGGGDGLPGLRRHQGAIILLAAHWGRPGRGVRGLADFRAPGAALGVAGLPPAGLAVGVAFRPPGGGGAGGVAGLLFLPP